MAGWDQAKNVSVPSRWVHMGWRPSVTNNERVHHVPDEPHWVCLSDWPNVEIDFRLTEVPNPRNGKVGYDVTRRIEVGTEPIRLKYFEEAFTSKEVMVRVFRWIKPAKSHTIWCFRVKTNQELESEKLKAVKKSKRKKMKKKKVVSNFKPSRTSLLF